jgi:hypothetical protein
MFKSPISVLIPLPLSIIWSKILHRHAKNSLLIYRQLSLLSYYIHSEFCTQFKHLFFKITSITKYCHPLFYKKALLSFQSSKPATAVSFLCFFKQTNLRPWLCYFILHIKYCSTPLMVISIAVWQDAEPIHFALFVSFAFKLCSDSKYNRKITDTWSVFFLYIKHFVIFRLCIKFCICFSELHSLQGTVCSIRFPGPLLYNSMVHVFKGYLLLIILLISV